jgi:hypothetical protein
MQNLLCKEPTNSPNWNSPNWNSALQVTCMNFGFIILFWDILNLTPSQDWYPWGGGWPQGDCESDLYASGNLKGGTGSGWHQNQPFKLISKSWAHSVEQGSQAEFSGFHNECNPSGWLDSTVLLSPTLRLAESNQKTSKWRIMMEQNLTVNLRNMFGSHATIKIWALATMYHDAIQGQVCLDQTPWN